MSDAPPVTPEKREIAAQLAAVGIGVAAFLAFAGWWVLLPGNIAWLGHGDPSMHTLGWLFFRDTGWQLPPGANPRLGIELANSIALVDGLPLFALPAKLLSAFLPQPFQYFGYWMLCCFALQALFAYLLARQMRASVAVALAAAGFAAIAPTFLFRLTMHLALAGHWTILAGLYLYARRAPTPGWAWPLLIAATAAIHAYLLAMLGAIWFASWVQRVWLGRLRGTAVAVEPVAIGIALAAVLWVVGFFYTGSLGAIGFGFFRLNLLGPLITYGSWSKLVPSLPHGFYDYEGMSFLGIGILACLALSVVTGSIVELRRAFTRRWAPLIVLCVLCWVFALSNIVGLGDREAAPIPIGPLQIVGDVFRSSGRFVWPGLYLITVGAVVLACRRLPRRIGPAVMAVLLALQLYDSSPAWSAFRRDMPPPAETWQTPLTSPVWDRVAAAGVKRVRGIPVLFINPDYRWLEYYAYTHGMDVDAIHLGRVDTRAIARLAAEEESQMANNQLDPATLYVVDIWTAQKLAARLEPDDLLIEANSRLIYLRHGAHVVDGLGIDPHSGTAATPWLPSPP